MSGLRIRDRQGSMNHVSCMMKSESRYSYSTFHLFPQWQSGSPDNDHWSSGEPYEFATLDYATVYEKCQDVINKHSTDNPLVLERETIRPASFTLSYTSSVYDTPTFPYEEGNFIRQQQRLDVNHASAGSHALLPNEQQISDVEFVTRAAAATNPSSADFDAAVFVAELRDLPGLFKEVGSTLSTYGANSYLKYQYGWSPFIKDLRKFFDVANNISKRMEQIKRLDKDQVLRRRFEPKDDPPDVREGVYLPDTEDWSYWVSDTDQIGVRYRLDSVMTTKRWAICEWRPTSIPKVPIMEPTVRNRAMRALYGGTVDGSTLWELMPWSWLADWTSNASEFLESQRDVVGAKLDKTILMKTTVITTSITPELSDVSGQVNFLPVPGLRTYVSKERILDIDPGAVITGELSLLGESPFKLSILGALGIQRLRL